MFAHASAADNARDAIKTRTSASSCLPIASGPHKHIDRPAIFAITHSKECIFPARRDRRRVSAFASFFVHGLFRIPDSLIKPWPAQQLFSLSPLTRQVTAIGSLSQSSTYPSRISLKKIPPDSLGRLSQVRQLHNLSVNPLSCRLK